MRDQEDKKEPAKKTKKGELVREEDRHVGVLPRSQVKEVF